MKQCKVEESLFTQCISFSFNVAIFDGGVAIYGTEYWETLQSQETKLCMAVGYLYKTAVSQSNYGDVFLNVWPSRVDVEVQCLPSVYSRL